MMFVKNPNLPENAKIVLLGEEYGFLGNALNDNGMDVILVPKNPNVDERLASHADLSVVLTGPNRICLAKHLRDSDFLRQVQELEFIPAFPDVCQNKLYPNDCQFNICAWSNFLLYNENTADKSIISGFLAQNGRVKLKCNQGYCKCLVSVVDSNSIITSDPGITKICREQGIDVLQISPGYIDLAGFDYGFIGGASFKSSKDTMFFTGHFDLHPDRNRILKFLYERNIEAKFLSDKNIFDVGSILPIIER